ncbi:hypothetical protein RJ640_018296, partial [Escallonia rubra]
MAMLHLLLLTSPSVFIFCGPNTVSRVAATRNILEAKTQDSVAFEPKTRHEESGIHGQVCVLADPGGVPPAYMPDIEHSSDSDPGAKKSYLEYQQVAHLSHCDKCAAYKPPRAHHCRVCRRCVLRMIYSVIVFPYWVQDHHCLWINNCVGHRNYKAFFVLVVYATVASMYSSVIIVLCTFRKEFDFNGRTPLKIFYITCGIMIVGLSLTLGTLLSWHIYLITQNMTTIEYYEGKRAAWLARKSGQNYRHPFNVGGYKNVTLVLGPNVMKWLCPTAVSHIKDGVDFPTARESLDAGILEIMQPLVAVMFLFTSSK